ncbi:MAG: hypothetical protein QXZ44_04175 [Ferroplasma sp.]
MRRGPFNFLISNLKSIKIDNNAGESVKLVLMADKFPYDENTFVSILNYCRLNPVSVENKGGKINLIFQV